MVQASKLVSGADSRQSSHKDERDGLLKSGLDNIEDGQSTVVGSSLSAGSLAGTIGGAMADAAFTSLVSQASVSLINNQGNIGKVLAELGSSAALRNLATSGAAVNVVIGGADAGEALKSGALSMASSMASQTLFKGIGDMAADLNIEEGDIRKVLAHALAGCAVGQISQNCVAGAIGAGLQELAGGAINQMTASPERQVQLSGLIAATAALLAGGDATAVNTANTIAQDARTYNRNLHPKEQSLSKQLAQQLADQTGRTQLQEREVIDQIVCVLVQCGASVEALDPTSSAYAERVAQLWQTYPNEMPLITNAILTLTDQNGQTPYAYTQKDAVTDRDIAVQPAYPEDLLINSIALGALAKIGIRATLSAAAPAIKVLARYNPLNAGPLPLEVVNTFRSGTYTEVITTQPTILYRSYGGTAEEIGSYWTNTQPSGPIQSIIDSALNQKWGNTAANVTKMEVPAGTRLFQGIAAPQEGLVGGGNQIVLPKDFNILPSWIVKTNE